MQSPVERDERDGADGDTERRIPSVTEKMSVAMRLAPAEGQRAAGSRQHVRVLHQLASLMLAKHPATHTDRREQQTRWRPATAKQ